MTTISLFNELKSGGYDACLLTSYSIDFPFYEDVLLRRMQTVGITHHMLFVDKRMCNNQMKERPPVKAGSQYSLVPMKCSKPFHPKILMLLGKKKGLLAVGSHNITMSGFGKNLELTNVLRFSVGKNESYQALFQIAYNAFKTWVEDYGYESPKSVVEAWSSTSKLAPWLTKKQVQLPEHHDLLLSSVNSEPLWTQLEKHLPDDVSGITALAPFFDKQLKLVSKLGSLSAQPTIIAIQPSAVSVEKNILLEPGLKVVDANYFVEKGAETDSKARPNGTRYIHAKAMYFDSPTKPLFVSGSANLSTTAWLEKGKEANVEAALVITGDAAEHTATNLSFNKLKHAPLVEAIDNLPISDNDEINERTSLQIVATQSDGSVFIAIEDAWGDSFELAFVDVWGDRTVVSFQRQGNTITIKPQELSKVPVLSVLVNDDVVGRIIVHNVESIRKKSVTGHERQIQEAWGSLDTDSPDLTLLFKCIENLSAFHKTKNIIASRAQNTQNGANDGKEKDLITDLTSDYFGKSISGRRRLASNDISQVLDIFIYSLSMSTLGDKTTAFGEDSLGRSEEELIGSDDAPLQPKMPESDIIEVATLCRKKVDSLLKRLAKKVDMFGIKKQTSAESLAVSLASTVLIHRLDEVSKKQNVNGDKKSEWVGTQHFKSLSKILFQHVLSDKVALNLADGTDSPFSSDEATQLLGYACWVAYKAGITFNVEPRLSATKEIKYENYWCNAVMLFLMQRINVDEHVNDVAYRLFTDEGNEALAWLDLLSKKGRAVASNNPHELPYKLASSPKGVYQGYRFLVNSEADFTYLASMNEKEWLSKFAIGFVELNKMDMTS
ncbi:hypothetical protein [Thalassotalea sp. ND16A]|uniref:hypothetical protein n=1 Tax=Thalassotalea sp. ND16A TaxID=1535422 RepID=UPI00051A7B92|nr:hypothetical protein [Thalassotalea sp. ND16A]KGJ99885.1 hypothetical protein ND16A_3673 [Thalassotalea sp. ND16A]